MMNAHAQGEYNIQKARRAFFALGSIGAFQGSLNPLTASSIFLIYVLPVLLYGCEAWFLSSHLITKLDQFQAEIGRRILGLSRFHTREAVLIGLRWPSLRCLVLHRKLAFLARLLSSTQDTLSTRILHTLAAHDIYEVSLVQQCRDLESHFGASILHAGASAS